MVHDLAGAHSIAVEVPRTKRCAGGSAEDAALEAARQATNRELAGLVARHREEQGAEAENGAEAGSAAVTVSVAADGEASATVAFRQRNAPSFHASFAFARTNQTVGHWCANDPFDLTRPAF
jgi:hypothetical protein